ncbi:phosphate propanoyltransferase [candidate division KSB1 bacterium]|nr:phosphate propanoyltransferase [candidate division KSB1 bacterium]
MTQQNVEALVEKVVRQVVDSIIRQPAENQKLIPIGISARHLHISQEHLEVLFGAGYHLTKWKDLNQPGEFAANETVTVVGPKRRLFESVRILGPTRPFTQVEMSFTDGIFLGIDLPYRLSGNIKQSAPVILIGTKGVLELKEGAIRAARHIHVNPPDAQRLGITDGQKVSVKTSGPLSITINEVIVRIKEGLNLEMHLDTDEANAAGLHLGEKFGILV